MMYPYMTLSDETEIVHSQIVEKNGVETLLVHFERATDDGFDSARCELPSYKWLYNEGFTEDEIVFLPVYLKAMPTFFSDMREMEESKLPSLFTVSGYRVFFWSNEDGEPIHVHICKGKPSPNATKLWLTKSGGCIVASNGSDIPAKELRELTEFVSAQFFMICAKWKEFFVTDEIKFYC